MRSLLALILMPGCGLLISEEEYLARITPELSGTVTVRERSYLPSAEAEVGLVGVELGSAWLYPDDPTLYLSTTLDGVAEGAEVDYALELEPTLSEAGFGELDPDEPGMTGQAWGLVVWMWAEGSAQDAFTVEDHYLAASPTQILAWIDEPMGRYLELGAIAGYNFLTYDFDRGRVLSVQPVETTRPEWNIRTNLAMTRREGLSAFVSLGPVELSSPALDIYRISNADIVRDSSFEEPTLLSMPLDFATGSERVSFDAVFEEPWLQHLSDEAPGVDLTGLGIGVAFYAGIAYGDQDGDGMWEPSEGELVRANSVSREGEETGYVIACFRPSAFRATLLEDASVDMGWQLIEIVGSEATIVDWSGGLIVD